jgi:hypothetical protein
MVPSERNYVKAVSRRSLFSITGQKLTSFDHSIFMSKGEVLCGYSGSGGMSSMTHLFDAKGVYIWVPSARSHRASSYII